MFIPKNAYCSVSSTIACNVSFWRADCNNDGPLTRRSGPSFANSFACLAGSFQAKHWNLRIGENVHSIGIHCVNLSSIRPADQLHCGHRRALQKMPASIRHTLWLICPTRTAAVLRIACEACTCSLLQGYALSQPSPRKVWWPHEAILMGLHSDRPTDRHHDEGHWICRLCWVLSNCSQRGRPQET